MQIFAEKGDFSNKKRPKRDPKSGLGLLRDPGLPKRDPVGSSAYSFGCSVLGILCSVGCVCYSVLVFNVQFRAFII